MATVTAAVDAGVSMIQIREKRLTAKQLFELVSDAVKITAGRITRLLVNDRADIAFASGADGVHLATTSLPVADVRRVFGQKFVIAVSTHSGPEMMAARDNGADVVVFGPVFSTTGKPEPVGVGELRSVCSEAGDFPVIALGGVSMDNYRSAIKAGAAGVAAIRMFGSAKDLPRIVREITNG